MLSLITYFSFLLALLIATRHVKIIPALFIAAAVWFAVATVQIQLWPWLKPLLGIKAA